MRQVLPDGVALFNQADLPGTTPAFDLFFPRNGVTNVRELLKVDQPSDAVLGREAGDEAALVLIHPPDDVVRDSNVYHSRATGHDVYAVGTHDLPDSRVQASRPASFFGALVPNHASEGGSSLIISFQARGPCHPERRRREGPAFPQMRRTCLQGPAFGEQDEEQQVLRSRAFRATTPPPTHSA